MGKKTLILPPVVYGGPFVVVGARDIPVAVDKPAFVRSRKGAKAPKKSKRAVIKKVMGKLYYFYYCHKAYYLVSRSTQTIILDPPTTTISDPPTTTSSTPPATVIDSPAPVDVATTPAEPPSPPKTPSPGVPLSPVNPYKNFKRYSKFLFYDKLL
jgi:hypothetical protein